MGGGDRRSGVERSQAVGYCSPGDLYAELMQLSQGGDVLLVKDSIFDEVHGQIIKDLVLYEAWIASLIDWLY